MGYVNFIICFFVKFLLRLPTSEIFINNVESPSQAEVTCTAGQSFTLGVKITNLSPTTLQQLQLTVQFYQDYQNGIQNYKLETRVILSGPDQ